MENALFKIENETKLDTKPTQRVILSRINASQPLALELMESSDFGRALRRSPVTALDVCRNYLLKQSNPVCVVFIFGRVSSDQD